MAIEKARRLSHFEFALDEQVQELIKKINTVIEELYPVGLILEYPWAELPPGTWLWLDDRTIGDGLSGATGRANNDTYNLFAKIWTDYNNTTAPIYTAAGGASTRGASAAADWTAHKRISLPKRQGRSPLAMDDYGEGGTAANITTASFADVLGGVGGEEKHPMTVSELAQHRHLERINGLDGGVQGTHVSGTNFSGTDVGSNPACYTDYIGSSTPFNVTHRVVTTKYIIRY